MTNIKPIFEHTNRKPVVAVLVSGSGTNLQAICRRQKELEDQGQLQYAEVKVVFTNVPGCGGTEIANTYNIPAVSLNSNRFFETLDSSPNDEELRGYFDAATIALIESVCTPDIIVLAGYRRKLSGLFYERYKNRIINLYPGDITKDYLVTSVQAPIQALRNNEKDIKATVYLEKHDTRFGIPILQSESISLQGYVEKDIDKINEMIRERAEWIIFPYVVHDLIAKGRIGIDDKESLYLDSKPIGSSGLQYGKLTK